MSRPADGGEQSRERRIRDRQRVMARLRRRAAREHPCAFGAVLSDSDREFVQWLREFFVRNRYRSRTVRHPCLEPNLRRVVKVMSLQERRALDAAKVQCEEAGVRCKLTRFRE